MAAFLLFLSVQFGQGLAGIAGLCFTHHQLEQLEIWKLESSVGLLTPISGGWWCQLAETLAWAFVWNTCMWPLHVALTSLQRSIWMPG